MLGVIATLCLSQAALSADEIYQRLEAPIRYQSEPVRLSVALDEIGALVGVRIRCESELQPAVVTLYVDGRPAKEAIQHLLKGVGGAMVVQSGTLRVGIPPPNEAQEAQRREEERKAINSYLDEKQKQLGTNEKNAEEATNAAGKTLLFIQNPGYVPYQALVEATRKNPVSRAAVKLLKAIGPELLQSEEPSHTISLSNIPTEKVNAVREVLRELSADQAVWLNAFSQVRKIIGDGLSYQIPSSLLRDVIAANDAKVDGFDIEVRTGPWGRYIKLEFTSAGLPTMEYADSLPRKRGYLDAGGKRYSNPNAKALVVDANEIAIQIFRLRDGGAVPYDWNLMRKLADPWKNEPLGYTNASAMPKVAQQLKTNLAVFLTDSSLNNLFYYNPVGKVPTTVNGEQALAAANYGTSGLREKDGWVYAYPQNPELYLSTQIDRAELGRYLKLALEPGALSFEQVLQAYRHMGPNNLHVARGLARIIRPGFDSLNPQQVEFLESLSKMSPATLRQARGGGIAFASLPKPLQARLQQFIGFRPRKTRDFEDQYDAPPTIEDIRKSRLKLHNLSTPGVMVMEGSGVQGMYNPYGYYQFTPITDARLLPVINEEGKRRLTWPATLDEIRFELEIPRKVPQSFGVMQFTTNVAKDPMTPQQLIRYIDGGR